MPAFSRLTVVLLLVAASPAVVGVGAAVYSRGGKAVGFVTALGLLGLAFAVLGAVPGFRPADRRARWLLRAAVPAVLLPGVATATLAWWAAHPTRAERALALEQHPWLYGSSEAVEVHGLNLWRNPVVYRTAGDPRRFFAQIHWSVEKQTVPCNIEGAYIRSRTEGVHTLVPCRVRVELTGPDRVRVADSDGGYVEVEMKPESPPRLMSYREYDTVTRARARCQTYRRQTELTRAANLLGPLAAWALVTSAAYFAVSVGRLGQWTIGGLCLAQVSGVVFLAAFVALLPFREVVANLAAGPSAAVTAITEDSITACAVVAGLGVMEMVRRLLWIAFSTRAQAAWFGERAGA